MKLLLLSTSSSRNAGGLYNSVRNLGQELFSQGIVAPKVLAFKDEYSSEDLGAYDPLPVEEYNIIGPPGVGFSLDLGKKIENYSPDIIHVQGIYLYSSYLNTKYSLRESIPYMISPRGMLDKWILNNNPLKKKIGFFLYEKKHLDNARCLHALGAPEFESIRDFGCKNPIAVLPNGVFLPADTKNTNPDEQSNGDDRKIILFLSRLHPKKGLENLMNAWTLLGAEKKEWKVLIAGESNGKEYTEDLIKLRDKLNLQNEIFFVGPKFHLDKENCFRSADAFILPSFSEGMPMAVLEAWSYKLPALITDECNLPDGIEKDAAIKIETNPDSIAKGLSLLFSMPQSERNQMGLNGFNLVKEKYTWSSIAKEITQVYDWMRDESNPIPTCINFY